MAEKERKKTIVRYLEGKDRKTDYKRAAVPESRMNLFWAILKGRFGRLVLLNFLIVLCFAPVIGIIVYRALALIAQDGLGPYGAGLLIGYPVNPSIIGYAESNALNNDTIFFSLLIPASAVAAIGVAGGAYLVRVLVTTNGIFSFRDFAQGIKRTYLPSLGACLFFTFVLFLAQLSGNYANFYVAIDSPASGWMIASKVIGYLIMSLVLLICLWMISLGASYKLGAWGLFKTAIALTIGTFPQTVLFAAVAVAPVFLVLFTSGFLLVIGSVFYIIFGFSFCLLVWESFTQWAFDRFITPPVEEDVRAPSRKGKIEPPMDEATANERRRRILVSQGRSRLMSRPVMPLSEGEELYQLPENFSRADIRRVGESRKSLGAEAENYCRAHIGDERYAEYNKNFEEREKALPGKKKKPPKKPPKMLNKR